MILNSPVCLLVADKVTEKMIKTLGLGNVPLRLLKKSWSQIRVDYGKKSIQNISIDLNPKSRLSREVKMYKDLTFELKGAAIIKSYPQPHVIPWEEVSTEFTSLNLNPDTDLQSAVINSCIQLNSVDHLMSYYKYLCSKGENIDNVKLFLIVKFLSKCAEENASKIGEEVLLDLYNRCKHILGASEFARIGGQIFSCIPHCFEELVQRAHKERDQFQGRHFLAARAFDYGQESVAWEILEVGNVCINTVVLRSFINYCIKLALEKKFSMDLLTRFVNFCQRKGFVVQTEDISCDFQPLITVLSHCMDDYVWSARKCYVNNSLECINCNTILGELSLTQEEFQKLKSKIHDVLFSKDIFLKSTSKELLRFNEFLNNCQPFNLVVDGLNFIYRGILPKKVQKLTPKVFLKLVKFKKLKVLVIIRKHFQNSSFFKGLPDVQFFHTENLSDDDLFVIYAALHGGPQTEFLTSDFFCSHSSKLDPETRFLFIKWQYFNQYIIDPSFGVILPRGHAGLPQCTETPETGGKSYKWHISFQAPVRAYSFRSNTDWLCIQAIPKKNSIKNVK